MIDYDKLVSELSENVRAAVASSGYCSISEFCKAKGLHQSSVTRIASGKRIPTLKSLVEIANAAGVSFASLMGPEAF